MHLEKLDIIFLIIIGFFVIKGLLKGLIKQAFGLISFFTSIVSALFLTGPVSRYLYTSQFASNLNAKVDIWLINKNAFFLETISSSNGELYSKAIEALSLPKFLSKFITNWLASSKYEGEKIHAVLGPQITKWILIIGSFIAILVLVLVILKILGGIFNSTINDSFLGLFNRLLGGMFGFAKSLIIISLFLSLLSLLSKVPFLNSMVDKLLLDHLSSEEFCITKYLYENNIIKYFFK